MDSKTRQFQYKILNRYLVTDVYLKKVGMKLSSDCSFCEDADESLEHLFSRSGRISRTGLMILVLN